MTTTTRSTTHRVQFADPPTQKRRYIPSNMGDHRGRSEQAPWLFRVTCRNNEVDTVTRRSKTRQLPEKKTKRPMVRAAEHRRHRPTSCVVEWRSHIFRCDSYYPLSHRRPTIGGGTPFSCLVFPSSPCVPVGTAGCTLIGGLVSGQLDRVRDGLALSC